MLPPLIVQCRGLAQCLTTAIPSDDGDAEALASTAQALAESLQVAQRLIHRWADMRSETMVAMIATERLLAEALKDVERAGGTGVRIEDGTVHVMPAQALQEEDTRATR